MSDINCHEIQENEIEAIRAIYMEDFEFIESNVKTWKVSKKFKEFRIRLCPFQEELKGIVEITMWAKLPSSYPKIPPEVSLESSKGITERQLDELKGVVKRKVNSAVGAEMIFDLADTILEYITSHHAGTEKSSFYEQMILRQEQKNRADEERALKEKERLLLLERERERLEQQTISQALEEDMLRKEKRLEDERRKKKLIKSNLSIGSVLEFDVPIIFPKQDSQAQPVSFQAVYLSYCLQEDPNKIYLATPYESKHLNISTIPPLTVEETIIFPTQNNKLLAIQELREIEESLETLKYIKHPGLLRLLAFKVETVEKDSSWRLFVLSETRLNAPTLKSVLRQNSGTGLTAFKAYLQELLRAVQMLHNNKLVYNCIRTENVFIDSGDDSTDDCTKTIFDQATSIIKLKPKPYVQKSNPTEKKSGIDGSWSPPEFSGEGVVSFKSDIWDIGIVLVEALFGSKVLHNSLSVQDLIGNAALSFPARDILASMLQQSPKERPSVQALLKHTFFKDDRNGPGGSNSGYQTGSSLGISALSQSPNDNQGSLLRRTSDFPTFVSKALSRYNNDFEEIQFLGKGGFGEVVKSRNKLDGRIYAVKKVRLDPRETESSRKILREVAALSRLHHQYIVRYYTAWLEDASGAWDDEDGFSSDSSFEEESTDYSQIHEADSDFLFTEASTSRRRHSSFGISFQKESKDYSEESSSVDSAQRVLYIQMEYCDRSTLRDVVDEGVSVKEAWNIFRQMLAGLDHLHSQGMIHRDLKPSNIFLASNGDVKIGDFGLATSSHNGAEVYAPGKQSMDFVQGSLTSEIGTSLYISPEVLTKARYSQKVDMYSLGIIFFEMLYPFSTGMERIVALRDLRLPEIRFPLNFRHDKLTAQAQIIRSLLSHNEEERPTAMELLRSQLLPSRMEDEFILECIRTVSNPSAPHYRHLIDTLFRTEPDRRSDLMYGRKALLGLDSVTGYYDVIRAILTKVFRRHGAVELSAPTLAPKAGSFSNLQKPYHALDQQGRVVQLPYDLTLPFSRMIAQTGMHVKRFEFGKVFRQNSEEAEGAPLEVMEADFDIVTSTADLASEAEVLKVLDEAMAAFPPGLTADYCFQINHGRIATLILDTCKVPAAHRATVAIILSQLGLSKTLAQVRALLGRGQLPCATVEELLVFYVAGDLESSHGRLRKLLKLHKQQVDLIFANLFTLQSYLRRLGVHRKVLFNSFLMYNLHYYEGGLLFRAARDGKRGDILAVGGRYDALLISQQTPLSGTRETPHAVGASIALQKLILMLERFETQRPTSRKPEDDRTLAIWTPRQLDVLIASFGPGLLEDRMDIAKELWSHHIRCDFVREPGELPTDTLGAQWVVFVKSSRREGIKVRNLLAKSECEVALSDLPNYLLYEIAEQARLDLQAAHRRRGDALHKMSEDDASLSRSEHPFAPPNPLSPEETAFGPFGVNVLSVSVDRINSKRKRMLMDRALAAVLRIAHNSFKSNTQVYIMEVPREDLRKFQDCYLYDEEGFKKVVAALPLYQRSQLQAARTALLALGHDPPTAWLYSVKDDCALNYQLIQHR